MELRSPRPFSFDGFTEFNKGYVAVLESWGIVRGGLNPVARTNVAPEVNPPGEPGLYAFSYTVPAAEANRDFVVSGGGELPEGSLNPGDVFRLGDVTAEGIAAKTEFVMGLMEGRLRGLGRRWADATVTQIYTVHAAPAFTANPHGGLWHFTRPPIVTIEYEMDVRGCRSELVL